MGSHPKVVGDHNSRVVNQHVHDQHIGSCIAERDHEDVLAAFEAGQAVIGPIHSDAVGH